MADQRTKIKKKKWVPIKATKAFNSQVIGEVCVLDQKKLIGRTVTSTLMDLKGDIKKQNIEICFKITDLKDGIAHTESISFIMASSSIKRMVRRSKEKIELSFTCETADGKKWTIKPIMITLNSVSNSVLTNMRKTAIDSITKYIKKIKHEELIDDLVSYKMQQLMKKSLSKVYPLKIFLIRYAKIIDDKKRPLKNVEEKPSDDTIEEPAQEEKKKTEKKHEEKKKHKAEEKIAEPPKTEEEKDAKTDN